MSRAVGLASLAALLRLLIGALVPVVPDEAYYWEWSRHLAAGYFDHPPAIAWLIRAGTALGGDTPFGVRLMVIIAGWLGTIAAALLARRLAGDRAAYRVAIVLSVVPLAGIGLVLATPDVPLLLCVALVLLALDLGVAAFMDRSAGPAPRTDHPAGRGDMVWWIAVGLAMGGALLSKYTAVLVPAGVALACISIPALRPILRRPGPYVACVLAACVFAPAVLWNARHEWISFAFQLRHGLGAPSGSVVGRELDLVGGQLGLVTPILLVLMVVAVIGAMWIPRSPRRAVVAILAATVWAFFIFSAMRRPVAANWPALAVLPAAIVLGTHTAGGSTWFRAGVLLAATVVLAVYVHAVHPWLPIPPARDPIGQAYGWGQLAEVVSRDTAAGVLAPGARRWIAADRYQDASELAFHLPGHPPVFALALASRHSQFDLWPTADRTLRTGDALTVVLDASGTGAARVVAQLAPHFARVDAGPIVELRWGPDRVVGRRRLWHFEDLRLPLSTSLSPAPP